MLYTNFILRGTEPEWFKFTEGEDAEAPYYQPFKRMDTLVDSFMYEGLTHYTGDSGFLWTIYGYATGASELDEYKDF